MEAQIQLILPRILYFSLQVTEEPWMARTDSLISEQFLIYVEAYLPFFIFFLFQGPSLTFGFRKSCSSQLATQKHQHSANVPIYAWTQNKRMVDSCSFVQCKSRTYEALRFHLYPLSISFSPSLSLISHLVLQSAWLSPSAANSTQLRYVHMQHNSFRQLLFFV